MFMNSGPDFGTVIKIITMDKKQAPVPPAATDTSKAKANAEKDIEQDPDLQSEPSVDDLDEGELAKLDNSND